MLKTKKGEEELIAYAVSLIQVYRRREIDFETCMKDYLGGLEAGADVPPHLNGNAVCGQELAKHFLVLLSNPIQSPSVLRRPQENEDALREQIRLLIQELKKLGIPHEKPSADIEKWLEGA